MNQIYSNFYKIFGIRRPQQLLMPRLWPMESFQFPRASIYHFVSHDPHVLNPDQSKSYLKSPNRRIALDVTLGLTSEKGNPRRNNKQAQTLFKPFFQKHKIFRYVRDAYRTIHDQSTMMVMDHAYLQAMYRYTITPLMPYYQWFNIEKTVWDTLKEVTAQSERQNFLFVEVPDVIPSITTLRLYENKLNNSMLHILDTPAKRFVLELWKWLDDKVAEGNVIPPMAQDQYDKINLIFVYKNSWCCLNMGLMNKWHKEHAPEEKGLQFSTDRYRRLLLKTLITIQSLGNTGEVTPDKDVESEASGQEEEPESTIVDNDDDDMTEAERPTTTVPETPAHKTLEEVEAEQNNEDDLDIDIDFDDKLFEQIDEELEALNHIEARNHAKQVIVKTAASDTESESLELPKEISYEVSEAEHTQLVQHIFQEKSVLDAIRDHVDTQADYGAISASDYKNILKQAEGFYLGKNPYKTDEPVKDFIQPKQEELVINKEKTQIRDKVTIPDKSMLKSALMSFDQQYVKKVLPKDVVGMITHIQKAGLVVQDYQIENETSVLGDYETHIVKVKPIDGASSTLKFRLPKVDRSGSFVANGNRYRMRKQRADLPLRKISPARVALSSYYGKVFVDRSTKKVNDSIDWLARQILGQGMSGEGYVITKVAPANVFDNHFQAPRLYSGLSHYIKQASIAGCEFTFDHTEREQWLSGEELAKAEGTEYRLVGRNSNKELIFMDYEDHLSVYRKGIHFPLGSFYDLCQIDITKSPIDFTELKIFAKSIPVGIVLGYMLGLTNLIKLLKVTPKIYDAKKRIVLNKDEWTIHFKDKKLVFSRQDRLATLILAGFRDYEKSVKNYFLESFDNKNVYLNVMETQGVGVRYIREIDQLNQLFIDPITLSILKELKLPITFMGLILKGSELLLTDDHPDAQDMQYQRIKGYERFAGAVYKELVNSVREFKSRNIRGKSQIEMNPYAVWQTIMQDPSNDLVKDINPIQNLKEEEAVTFVGEGGRSKEGMNKESRAYHPNDMGVVSEATVDSSDVGINAFLSADPNLTSVRGLTTRYDRTKGVTSLVSTSALLSPGASKDD